MAQLKSLTIGGKPVADFIVEQGTADIWFYRKWNSGKIELYANQRITGIQVTTTETGGTVAHSSISSGQKYAFAIPSSIGLNSVIFNNVNITDNLCWVGGTAVNDTQTRLEYTIFRTVPYTTGTITAYINAYILGGWK